MTLLRITLISNIWFSTVHAVNTIDLSALESLEAINLRLKDSGITFHLSEIKGPVMDRLKGTHFIHALTGKVYLTQFAAVSEIREEISKQQS